MLPNPTHLLLPCLVELETPKSLALAIMLRYNDFSGLVHIGAEPVHYVSPEKYFRDVQALALFTKFKSLSVPGIDRRAAALSKWWDAERACYRSNERLSPFLFHSFEEQDKGISDFFSDVRKKIVAWIGPKPPDLDKIEGRFGPGSTFSDRGRLTTVPDKISSNPTLTASAFWYLLPFWKSKWGIQSSLSGVTPSYVRGNRFSLVPKNYKTDRAIAIEPAINVFYQLGLGTSIRKRLKYSTGWDLGTAQDIHRLIACEASRTEEFATLDLSSASDTVCSNLVKLVMPPAWYDELNALRSPYTLLEGKWVRLEKFSSMGNGYTFELETLIFSALASTWLERVGLSGNLGHELFVYGDDIIMPTKAAKGFMSVLSFCGFSINPEKSFITGPFRESCGGDYWDGRDVRPWYRKDVPVQPLDFARDVNGLNKASMKLHPYGASLENTWKLWLGEIPLPYRNFRGPQELGDILIHDVPKNWRFRWKDSIRTFPVFVVRSRFLPWHHWKPDVVLACALYGAGSGYFGIIPRNPPVKYVRDRVPFS